VITCQWITDYSYLILKRLIGFKADLTMECFNCKEQVNTIMEWVTHVFNTHIGHLHCATCDKTVSIKNLQEGCHHIMDYQTSVQKNLSSSSHHISTRDVFEKDNGNNGSDKEETSQNTSNTKNKTPNPTKPQTLSKFSYWPTTEFPQSRNAK
ncbi:unnamed protein product, partial [Owenia fusiformis]